MNTFDPSQRIKEQRRKLREAANKAFAILKQHPDYAAVQLRGVEETDSITASIGATLPIPAFPSPARLDYAIKLMDSWASAYVLLISTVSEQEAFCVVLMALERQAWEQYCGIAEIEPLANNLAMKAIKDRVRHWYKESFRRLIPRVKAEPTESRRGYREEVRAWMTRKEIPSIQLAAKRLCISTDVLKSIMASRGKVRYGKTTLTEVLKKITTLSL